MRHTPGPWKRRSIPGHLFEIEAADGPVLRIRGGLMPTLADARLIEAAPTMFTALEQAAEYLNPRTGIRSEAALSFIRAAIASAKGQA